MSSRSHCVLSLTVERRSPGGPASDLRTAKLTLVDLAGSERQSETGATGQTFRESVSINQSLFVLRKVITALARRHTKELALVPYRESKLTTLLRDAVGGSSYTLMIACLSPNDSHYEENLSTLHYAATAGRIRNRPAVNLDPKSAMIHQLRSQVSTLRDRLSAAHAYIVRLTGRPLPEELEGARAAGATVGAASAAVQAAAPLEVQHSQPPPEPLPPPTPASSSSSMCPVPRRPPQPPPPRGSRGATPPQARQQLQQASLAEVLRSETPVTTLATTSQPFASSSLDTSDAVTPRQSVDAANAEGSCEVRDKENELPGDGWARLSKQFLAGRLCEAVSALRDAAAENANLRRDCEILEAERDGLRQKAEGLERELVERELVEAPSNRG